MKMYQCRGYSFASNNGHLLSVVGDTHSIDKWLEVAYRDKADKAREFFDGWSDAEIIKYLHKNLRIRLEKI